MASAGDLFIELFRGNMAVHGQHIPAARVKEGEKAKGESFTRTEPVTRELYQRHCYGDYSLGIVPIDQNNNVRFVAIDIDVYPCDPRYYAAFVDRYKLPLTIFRSKSGGAHAYCFFSADTPAARALDLLHVLRHLLRIPSNAETFPKQRRLTAKQKGNWINLPYFGGELSERYAYNPSGERMTFETAMNWCYNRRTTLKGLEACLESLPFSNAPPCLQSIFMNSEVSVNNKNRNIFLFNAAVYLKSRFKDEFSEKLIEINDELDKPLNVSELENTVIASHSRGSYTYQCEDSFLHEHCLKELCKGRDYGKGCGTISNFSFEKLTQVKSMPPYYKWLVNGVEMVFFSETELRNQDKFMDFCVRHLHRLPNKLKQDAWTEILNSALADIEVEEVSTEDDLSSVSLWASYLREFLTERQMAQRPSQITMGQVYKSGDKYYFRVEDFYNFLTDIKRFRSFTTTEIHYHLKRKGFYPQKIYDPSTKKALRAWAGEALMLEGVTPPPPPAGEDKKSASNKKGAARLSELLTRANMDYSELDLSPGESEPDAASFDAAMEEIDGVLEGLNGMENPEGMEGETPLDFSHLKEDEKF